MTTIYPEGISRDETIARSLAKSVPSYASAIRFFEEYLNPKDGQPDYGIADIHLMREVPTSDDTRDRFSIRFIGADGPMDAPAAIASKLESEELGFAYQLLAPNEAGSTIPYSVAQHIGRPGLERAAQYRAEPTATLATLIATSEIMPKRDLPRYAGD